jgi:glyoxylase-like metal-dependent hydrolase (beta-lactamase superfamily II)
MRRREALALLGKLSAALLCGTSRPNARSNAAEKAHMSTPSYIRHTTANNPGYMTLKGTNQYVVGKSGGVIVIDVALSAASNLDGIIEQTEAMGAGKIEKILLTHIHSDHCGGALALKKRCGAKIGIHRSRAGYLGGEDFQYGEGDRIAFSGGEVKVLHTPGHESGHCCFYETADRVLFSGDHIMGFGTSVIRPPDGDMTDYIRSLERLLELEISLILPGHGPLVAKPEAKIKEYIEHRLMREQQVITALRQGRDTIAAITEIIYVDISGPLKNVAEFSVEAHLIKLMREGRVQREGSRYRLLN